MLPPGFKICGRERPSKCIQCDFANSEPWWKGFLGVPSVRILSRGYQTKQACMKLCWNLWLTNPHNSVPKNRSLSFNTGGWRCGTIKESEEAKVSIHSNKLVVGWTKAKYGQLGGNWVEVRTSDGERTRDGEKCLITASMLLLLWKPRPTLCHAQRGYIVVF